MSTLPERLEALLLRCTDMEHSLVHSAGAKLFAASVAGTLGSIIADERKRRGPAAEDTKTLYMALLSRAREAMVLCESVDMGCLQDSDPCCHCAVCGRQDCTIHKDDCKLAAAIAALSVFSTVGLIQYVKQLWTKAPSWVWKLALPVLGALSFTALSLMSDKVFMWVLGFALVIAGGQIFYEVTVELIAKIVAWIKSLIKK